MSLHVMRIRTAIVVILGGALVFSAAGCGLGIRVPRVDRAVALKDAHDTLQRSAVDKGRFTRSAAIEAMVGVLGAEGGQVYLKALGDKEANVRFAAALALGDARYAPAKARLLQMAKRKTPGAERDQRVFCGVIYALQRLGCNDYVHELGKLLFHKENEVRADAALVIGKIGWPDGIEPLKAVLDEETSDNIALRLQLLESLSMLGHERSRLMLQSYVSKPFLLEKLVALRAMGRIGGRQTANILKLQEVLARHREIVQARVAAAGALARMGKSSRYAYDLCLTSAHMPVEVLTKAAGKGYPGYRPAEMEVVSLQRLAAISLGWMGRDGAANVLHPLLKSPDGGVRVAAAMSIIRLLPDQPAAAATVRKRSFRTKQALHRR